MMVGLAGQSPLNHQDLETQRRLAIVPRPMSETP
ncbi:hypothetical protein Pan265_00150 [Mucisphaera calidilacus]|uniref:Uncharacterized protein n=1 Tax=Mucisphaera calidilacus TaxID=2527982 RepID=A0A518BT90_9BACT|nr:hypothetical protein Pan265_00150 [Mucisphaera calidilacus]